MKAIRVAQYGQVEGLSLQELASPVPGQGEVLIEVAGSGVNPIDWKVLSGAMKAFIPLQLPTPLRWLPVRTVSPIGPIVYQRCMPAVFRPSR